MGLTEKQIKTLVLLASGLNVREISERTRVSIPIVRNTTKEILTKLGVHTAAGAVGIGFVMGIISDMDVLTDVAVGED
ncbi:Transcription regulator LuxR, C-terminal [uncultured Caudovirales phage]|uniref:Transcription regulator LuxR, C-terminal n=1 Tax=uncultured Caudovirales phage TaxID=2100421 RepID=A0A6J5RGA1_9CAUD|nr:Transcription regulator LuxR, C-terminal [uncultured Caudovirales phage]